MQNKQQITKAGITLVQQNRLAEARSHFEAACNQFPDDAELLLYLGHICARLSDATGTETCLRKAREISAGDHRISMQLANLLLQTNRLDEACRLYEEALANNPSDADAHCNLASIHAALDQPDKAVHHYKKALEIRPGHIDSLVNLGIIYEILHKIDDARNAAEQALSLDPSHTFAMFLMAKIERRASNFESAENFLRKVLSHDKSPTMIANAAMHLGAVLDRRGKYDEAFSFFTLGNNTLSKLAENAPFDKQECQRRIAGYRNWLNKQSPQKYINANRHNWRGKSPIFFVGFPRSGTTLVEQILNQEESLVTTNETPLIQQLINAIPELKTYPYGLTRFLHALDDAQAEQLRQEYWQKAKLTLGDLDNPTRLIDKLPLNIIELGFIHKIFPDAHVLVALRDPRDACLSCFMQVFELNPAMSNFLSLQSSIDFYTDVMDLWLKYRSTLPIKWHEYRYEDLVDDFETTTRSIYDFLDLEWSRDILNYHESASKHHIKSPSYQDVTKPLYNKAIGRWKNYSTHFDPYQPKLRPFLDEFDYNR